MVVDENYVAFSTKDLLWNQSPRKGRVFAELFTQFMLIVFAGLKRFSTSSTFNLAMPDGSSKSPLCLWTDSFCGSRRFTNLSLLPTMAGKHLSCLTYQCHDLDLFRDLPVLFVLSLLYNSLPGSNLGDIIGYRYIYINNTYPH